MSAMSTLHDPTIEVRPDPTHEFAPAQPAVSAGPATEHAGSRDAVRPEDPKRNPITYLALAIALLALLLSLVALTRDNGPQQIDVGGKRCIVDRIEGNPADTLFCQT